MNSSEVVSLKNLFINGLFGSVVLGMNSTQVRLLLGQATAEYQYGLEWIAWFYGDIEFLFRNQVLYEINWQPNLLTYDPYLPNIGLVTLDTWIVWNGLTLPEAERDLKSSSIDYRKVTIPSGLTFEGDSVVKLIANSNARLIFRGYLDWFLEKFSLSNQLGINTSLESFIQYYTY